jgi:hypothetical protein
MTATVNLYEIRGRLEKAFRIACALQRAGITPEQALLQTHAEWVTTAACAGCKPPSEATREIVIEKLRLLWSGTESVN